MKNSPTTNPKANTWAWLKIPKTDALPRGWATPKRDRMAYGIDYPAAAFNVSLLVRPYAGKGIIRSGFPSKEKMRKEDDKRAAVLRKYGGWRGAAVADRLDGMKTYESLVSAVWMREFKIIVLGEVLRSLAPYPNKDVFLVTLINKGWEVKAGSLDTVKAHSIRRLFEQHLNRCGATAAPGVLFGWIHGEYDSIHRLHRLHVHVLCTREKADQLRSLKGKWGYEKTPTISRPTFFQNVEKACAGNPGYSRERAATYAMQLFHVTKLRRVAQTQSGIKVHKTKERRRLPPVIDAETLLWFASQKPSDFIIAQPNIRLKKHRLP